MDLFTRYVSKEIIFNATGAYFALFTVVYLHCELAYVKLAFRLLLAFVSLLGGLCSHPFWHAFELFSIACRISVSFAFVSDMSSA